MTPPKTTIAVDVLHLPEVRALALAADQVLEQQLTGATVSIDASAFEALDAALERIRGCANIQHQ
jgi:hypothetical protein